MDAGALLELLRQDPAAGTEALLRQYGPLLHYVVGSVLRDRQDAEDCYSEVTELVWRRLEDYDPARGSLTAWLTAVARNTALNHLKARLRREQHLAQPETEPAHRDTPEEAVLRQERTERLQKAIAALSTTDQRLFYRRYYLFTAHRPDCRGDGHDGARRRGQALPPAPASAPGVGR